MRKASLLPLAVMITAACAPEPTRPAKRTVPERDFILPIQAPSPRLELGARVEPPRQQPMSRRGRHSPRISPRRSVDMDFAIAPVAQLPVSQRVAAEPIEVEHPAPVVGLADVHELPPGHTVSVIPAGGGSSLGPGPDSDLPPAFGGAPVSRSGGTAY